MKNFCIFICVILIAVVTNINAATEPVCSYKSIKDDTVFLKYLPLLKKGEDYVDFGEDGKCVKRATCSDTFKTEVEDCSKYKISCANKNHYKGVFPACCVKC